MWRKAIIGVGVAGALLWLLIDDAEAADDLSAPPVPVPPDCPGLVLSTAPRLDLVSVAVPNPPGKSLSSWRLRADVAEAARRVVDAMVAVGARPSSSGGTRPLHERVTSTRSPTSLHYLGCALDLWIGGGMTDPRRDPYIITRDGDRLWRVWARCAPGRGRRMSLEAVRSGAAPMTVDADVIDLTQLMACHGLHRIRSRADAWEGIEGDQRLHGGTEWWHFEAQLPDGAVFGDELRRIYPEDQLVGSPPWASRAFVYQRGMFREVA